MIQHQKSDDRQLLTQPLQLELKNETGISLHKRPVTIQMTFWPGLLFALAIVLGLFAGAIASKSWMEPLSKPREVSDHLGTSITSDDNPAVVPNTAGLMPANSANDFNQIAIPPRSTHLVTTHRVDLVQEPEASITDKGVLKPTAQDTISASSQEKIIAEQALKTDQRMVQKQAFFDGKSGVGKINIVFNDENSPVVPPDHHLGISDRDKRTSYAVFTPRYRNKDDGDYHLTELTVQFLFRGNQPLDVSIQSPLGPILRQEPVNVVKDQQQYRQSLEEWWNNFAQQGNEFSSQFSWVHRSVTEMLSRRLELSLPNGWVKKKERRSMAKVEQDFERILSTLLGIDSVLIAMGQELPPDQNDVGTADQPLPTAVNIRPVRTSFANSTTTVEEIAMRVPQECFYVRCGSLHNYEWLRSFVTHWNGSLEEIVKVGATDRRIRQRLEKQLALDLESCKKLGLEKETSDVALIGCDLHFGDGPAIGVIFESRNPQAVNAIIQQQRANCLKKNSNAKQQRIDIRRHPVSLIHSPGNVIRSFSVESGRYHLVTNSKFIASRFIEASAGSGSMGRLNEFLLARQKVPSAESNVVQIYLSDPFFRQVVSPRYRIESTRRKRAVEELKQLSLARVVAQAEEIQKTSPDRLIELEYLPWNFNQRPDGSKAQINGQSVVDSDRGAWGTFRPIADTHLVRATPTEVSAYQRFASDYLRQWRRMDPVVANLSVTPNGIKGSESVKLDILVVPYARQRYALFNRYLSSATSRQIGTAKNDLIAVTIGLRSPIGGTMLARMGILDELIEYSIENGQVLTTGKHRGRTLAKNNLYVVVDSAANDGLKRVGAFVKSLQGDSPFPDKPPRRSKPSRINLNAFNLLDGTYFVLGLGRILGDLGKASSIKTHGKWTIMGRRSVVRDKIARSVNVDTEAGNCQVHFEMVDINRSKAHDYIKAYTYMESRRISSANVALLNYMGHQLPLSMDRAPELIEQILGVKLLCPLGREYCLAGQPGKRYWSASSDKNDSYFDVSSAPVDYRFPFLDWLRGMELDFNLSGTTLTSSVRMTTRQTLPGQPTNMAAVEKSKIPSASTFASEHRSIQPGDAVVVTADPAQLKLRSSVLAEIPKGRRLQVSKVQDDWVWTFVNKNGRRTEGWVNIRQVTRYVRRALKFDGANDFVAGPNIAFDAYKAFTVEAWVLNWKKGVICQGRAGDPENSVWLSTGTRTTRNGSPHESCGWESGKGKNFEMAVGRGVPGKWNHIAMVYDGQRQYFFMNGKLLRSSAAPKPGPFVGTRRFLLAAHEYSRGLDHASGLMGSVRISKVARYRTGFRPTRLYSTDKDTILLYNFDEGEGTILHDSSGYNRHATIKGAQWIKVDQVSSLANAPRLVKKSSPLVEKISPVVEKPSPLVKKTSPVVEKPSPLVEKYFYSGELSKGELALEAALMSDPSDDQIRFGLGLLQLVRGVERLGQSLHQYGAKPENTNIPFLRLPVPENPDPATINYIAFRRVLDDLARDLRSAEATLAGVTDDDVKLPLRLADIQLDLDGDGKPTDKFIDILKKIMQQDFGFLKDNPEFLVGFDRGDVAWYRAYCHLLMGMIDGYLALDTEQLFDLSADELFAKPKIRLERVSAAQKARKIQDAWKEIAVTEPARLGRCRQHLLKVTELNLETWNNIRAESDDDHEWLPNPKQKGVLAMPVRANMIDAWLAMMTELEALLDGNRTFLKGWWGKNGKGINLKKLFDEPPDKFVFDNDFPRNLPDKYFTDHKDVDINVLSRAFTLFGNTTAVGYAAWFN